MKRKPTLEYKTVWIDNTDEAIQKRTRWYVARGWQVVGTRVTSSNPNRISVKFRIGATTMTTMKVYAHQMQAATYQLFIDAGIPEWWDFSRQFKYAQAWAAFGVFTPTEAKAWAAVVEGDPVLAAEFKAYDFTPETAVPWIRNTIYKPAQCAELVRQGRTPRTIIQPKPQRTR